MNKILTAAALATTMGLGFSTAAVVPASAQVLLQLGNQDTPAEQRADQRADQIERRGERRAERAADNGNYAKAAKIQRKTENRADRVQDRANDGNDGVILRLN